MGHAMCEGCAKMEGAMYAGMATGAVVSWGALWATKRVRGAPKWTAPCMRVWPLGPYLRFPMGHEACEGCANMDGYTWRSSRRSSCSGITMKMLVGKEEQEADGEGGARRSREKTRTQHREGWDL